MTFGVLQESMEGPTIFFFISLSDIVNSASNVNTVLFADDTIIFLTDRYPVRTVHRLYFLI